MEDNRPDKGHQAKNSPHFKGKGKGKGDRLDLAQAARLTADYLRTGAKPPVATLSRMPEEFRIGCVAIQATGLAGVEEWLEGVRVRLKDDPERLSAFDSAWAEVSEPPKRPRFRLYSSSELARAEFRPEWLCRGILVARETGVVGAPKKSLKTSSMIDLAISLASATPFLGHFDVPRPTTTILMSGESGGAAIQSTARRVCEAKGIDLEILDGRFIVSFDIPKLADPADLVALGETIRETGAKVIIVDPLYLCLMGGDRQVDTANLFHTGPLLKAFASTCLDAGATPILVHHFKQGVADPHEPPELGNLSYSGVQEFARQWILLGRRERFVAGSGLHKLWLSVGGSIGMSGQWAIDVNEGTMAEDFSGRTWDVVVKDGSAIIAEEQEAKRLIREAKENEKELERKMTQSKQDNRVLEAVHKLGGKGTRAAIRDALGVSASVCNAAIARLIASKHLVEMLIEVKRGKSSTASVMGVSLPSPGLTWTHLDKDPV